MQNSYTFTAIACLLQQLIHTFLGIGTKLFGVSKLHTITEEQLFLATVFVSNTPFIEANYFFLKVHVYTLTWLDHLRLVAPCSKKQLGDITTSLAILLKINSVKQLPTLMI